MYYNIYMMNIYKVYVFVKSITITNINDHIVCTYKAMFKTNTTRDTYTLYTPPIAIVTIYW